MKAVIKVIIVAVFLIPWMLLFARPSRAAQTPVSATVPDLSVNPPILISPGANATVQTTRPTLSWSRPSPLPISPLNHFDLYLDGALFASSLSNSLTSVDFYFYSASASGGIFYVSPKTDLTQGYHTWSVTAFNDAGNSASSETRTFYIDSISPFVSLTSVEELSISWTSSIPASIPAIDSRYFTVQTASPLLKGGVEAYANFQIILVCPQNIPCTNQTYTSNAPTALWEHRFSGLINGRTYTLKASATDAAGNSTTFPDFFITYGTSIIVTPSASPSATLTGSPTPTTFPELVLPSPVTPPPGLLNVITPTQIVFRPPVSPTPPPVKSPAKFSPIDLFYNFLIVLIIFGLPLHLTMAAIGTKTPLRFIHQFLFILAYPFLRAKKYRTSAFCFIDIFISDKLDHPWQSVVTDTQGYFNLKSPIPENIYISLSSIGRSWKNNLFKGQIILTSCLFPMPTKPLDDRSRLLKSIYDIRAIPLIVALLTSTTAMIIRPSYFILIYIYFSLQYAFSEYLYPKINK